MIDEKEKLLKETIAENENKMRLEEVRKSEELKNKNKKRKQSLKDQRKAIKKRKVNP